MKFFQELFILKWCYKVADQISFQFQFNQYISIIRRNFKCYIYKNFLKHCEAFFASQDQYSKIILEN